MRFTPTRTFAALALIFGALTATNTGAVRPQPVADGTKLVTPAWTPVGLSKQSVTVVVQLTGDPVAVQQEAAGRKLTRSEKDQAKNKLKGDQNALRGSIEKLGGTVLAGYQSSYNGIKVRITRDKAAQLATLPGVMGVRPLQIMRPGNTNGIPLIGAPSVWQNSGFHGENVKIAIIDTGIDYTHKNFGGPGTVAAYNAAHAAETSAANPALFGPLAKRVKGGTDLVGDSYNADPDSLTYQPIPHPDPNPLDCNGHGSHVAGTAAGSGVTSAGATYTGAYNASTISGNSWNVGPGVAPKADLYAIRVFGCDGSTDVVVDAIEWAVDNDMDVINMSLGSDFGTKDDPSAVASTNAAKAGVIVVTSAGNAGPGQYITGSPGTAAGAIATAANDPSATFPAATITIPSGPMTAINANGYAFTVPLGYTVKTIVDNPATPGDESLGCSVADFGGPLPPNTIAVVTRGVCARVAKAIYGQQAGAAAVVMVNTSATLPPFEGKITQNPDDGTPYTVTIPFLGVKGTNAASDGGRLRAANGQAATVAGSAPLANPAFTAFATFSSAGPRTGDSGLKPDITAPGVSIVSTSSGSGFEGTTLSGTSMASPHVAGVAALTRQAHPNWNVEDIKAVIVNTGLPSGVLDYKTSRGGTGLVQPVMSTKSQVSAFDDDRRFAVSLNFGFEELKDDFSDRRTIKLKNHGSTAATFNVAQALATGSTHTVTLNKTSVRVPARGDAEVEVRLKVPAATAGNSTAFREVAGLIQFTPATAADNGNVTLRVPYYMVPRAKSDVSTQLGKFQGTNPATVAIVTNKHGVIAGNADFYAWGLEDRKNRVEREDREDKADHKDATNVSHDLRAIGVQSFPIDADEAVVVFAVNTYNRWSNASTNEFDLTVDVDGDGIVDYIVVGVDYGAVTAGVFNGQMGSFVFSTRSGGASIEFLADAPTDSSTALLPVLASQLCRAGEPCLNAANPRITYGATSFDLQNGGIDPVDGTAKFNVWTSSISTGGFASVAPGGSDSSNVIAIDSVEWALTPALGVMVVSTDNKSGKDEAQLLDVKIKK
jgi:minor extracellular serine protease Vpr